MEKWEPIEGISDDILWNFLKSRPSMVREWTGLYKVKNDGYGEDGRQIFKTEDIFRIIGVPTDDGYYRFSYWVRSRKVELVEVKKR